METLKREPGLQPFGVASERPGSKNDQNQNGPYYGPNETAADCYANAEARAEKRRQKCPATTR